MIQLRLQVLFLECYSTKCKQICQAINFTSLWTSYRSKAKTMEDSAMKEQSTAEFKLICWQLQLNYDISWKEENI